MLKRCTKDLSNQSKEKKLKVPLVNLYLNMAELMQINEPILSRVFRDHENPMDTFNDEQLILNYRFDRQSIHELSDHLELDHSTFHSCALPAVLQLSIALWFYATGLFQSVIGEVFHVHKSTVCRVIHSF